MRCNARPSCSRILRGLIDSGRRPKTYVRDTGLVHALLQLDSLDALAGHPIVGSSWEAFVLEALLRAAPSRVRASFYRTVAGAEIDLLLEVHAGELWAIEIKRGNAPKLERGFHSAREDLQPTKLLVVYSGSERYPLGPGIEAIGVRDAAQHTWTWPEVWARGSPKAVTSSV
jgi:predicted AAA+ superfamily ATPase